ncbi:hypothetical protein BLA9940_03543 [Burkholderia aenigmatica]|nr:hypothetical protein BLA9940_03543 [Burkholderia aenigmatica]
MAWCRNAGIAALRAHEKTGRGVRDPVGVIAECVTEWHRNDANDV